MVRVILQGKIGNQLFQYATGRHLSMLRGTGLLLDISQLKPSLRAYTLKCFSRFNIAGEIVDSAAVRAFKAALGKALWQWFGGQVYLETGHVFDPSVLNLPERCVLVGFFQSEKYFKAAEDLIRTDLSFKELHCPPGVEAMAQIIKNEDAVSIHVRRQDYIASPRYHICTAAYYHRAMERIRARVPNARFFVFSDDMKWCSENFQGPEFVFSGFPESQDNPVIDLYLMSLCKHHIIANSSFSWWGAWLNNNERKIVLTPNIWFNDPDVPMADKICDRWEPIEF